MASLVSESNTNVLANHTLKSAEQVLYGQKAVYSEPNLSQESASTSSSSSTDNKECVKGEGVVSKLMQVIDSAKHTVTDALSGSITSGSSEIEDLRKQVADLKLNNDTIQKEVADLRELVQKLAAVCGSITHTTSVISTPKPNAPVPVAAPSAAAKAAGGDDEEFDLFGSEEDEEESAEQAKVREERLAAYAAKKSKKPGPIAKSSILLDVKPWDDETDLKEMENCVRSIQKDGLNWGGSKLVPVGYGIQKLQIMCTVEDEKISVDVDLVEHIQDEFADFVQSVDIAAFNKI